MLGLTPFLTFLVIVLIAFTVAEVTKLLVQGYVKRRAEIEKTRRGEQRARVQVAVARAREAEANAKLVAGWTAPTPAELPGTDEDHRVS